MLHVYLYKSEADGNFIQILENNAVTMEAEISVMWPSAMEYSQPLKMGIGKE